MYKVKADKSYKGRVVVLGWGQVPGVDCGGTFAPVCRLQSICMVLAIAAGFDFECWQLDYNTAFLNATVEEEVYVKMAPGYEEFSNDGVPTVMRLLKSLWSPAKPKVLVWHRRQTRGGDRFQKPQVGPLCLHLLRGLRHLRLGETCCWCSGWKLPATA
ncbi:unnamed protein product [Ascophyllum nodosum]